MEVCLPASLLMMQLFVQQLDICVLKSYLMYEMSMVTVATVVLALLCPRVDG